MTVAATARSPRLDSLDAFRGLTIAGMILVNNPGDWGHIYGPLGHAEWYGWTPTDLVFPFFLFIVGVSIALSFTRRLKAGAPRGAIFVQVVRRSAMIFFLGLALTAFISRASILPGEESSSPLEDLRHFPIWRLFLPLAIAVVGLGLWPDAGGPHVSPLEWTRRAIAGGMLLAAVALLVLEYNRFQTSHLRIPGVLQRIAICYLVASAVVLSTGTPGRVIAILLLLGAYTALCFGVHPPAGFHAEVVHPDGLLHEWIDQHVFGAHVYRERPDPEGLLSTLPAIATTLLGALAGHWLVADRDRRDQALGLFAAGGILMLIGCFAAYWIPVGKKLWTASYVLLTAGLALEVLAMCFYSLDVRGRKKWAWPFIVFGTNAILVFTLSGMGAKLLNLPGAHAPDGKAIAYKTWLMANIYTPHLNPHQASLAFALSYVALWLLLLIPLYRRRIFLRI